MMVTRDRGCIYMQRPEGPDFVAAKLTRSGMVEGNNYAIKMIARRCCGRQPAKLALSKRANAP